MPLPLLGFTTVDAKSPLLTAFRCPFALVNSNGAQKFVNEAHGNLLFSQRTYHIRQAGNPATRVLLWLPPRRRR